MNAVVNLNTSNVVERQYQGMSFKFREDGYFNMAHAAKQFGKHLPHFWNSPETEDYKEALFNAISSTTDSVPLELVEVIPGNRYVENRGTWAHPKLAVFFARWLDVKFAVFCDMVIDDLTHGYSVLSVIEPEKAVAHKLPQTYLESLQELIESVKEQERLKVVVHEKEVLLLEQAPKVEFVDEFVDAQGALGIQAASRLLRMNMRELGHWLVDDKLCFRRPPANTLIPYSTKIDQGLFVVKTGLRPGSDGPHAFEQMKITTKGLTYIAENAPKYVRK